MQVAITVKMRWDAQDRGKTNLRLFYEHAIFACSFYFKENYTGGGVLWQRKQMNSMCQS